MGVKIHSEIKVCDDCMFVHANGECDPDRPEELPAPWALWEDNRLYDLAMGGKHSKHCTPADRENGCDCETTEYSTSRCDGCGDTHHGRRHTFTVFYRYTWECLGPGLHRYGMYLAKRTPVRVHDRQWLVKSHGAILGWFPLLADAKADIEDRVRKG